jgi:hypothetical protein
VIWPRSVLRPRNVAINVAPATVAGAAALSGFRQAVSSPAGVWAIRFDGLVVTSRAAKLCLRALGALVEGRSTPIVLPVYDREDLRPVDPSLDASAPHSDGSMHDDGTGYGAVRAQIVVDGAVALGANQMTTETIVGETIEPGMHFSAGHRLYRVRSIVETDGANTTFTFWPIAREAILDGAELEFDEPVCLVRLAEDAGLDFSLDAGLHGFPSIAFIEDPT